MQPYVIKQGDYLALVAFEQGFDAQTVWNDPKNAALQALRPDPNILFAGDVLYIPDPLDPPPGQTLQPGSTHSFTSDAPTVTVNLKFTDPDLASQPFTIVELPELTGLSTGGDGSVTLAVPIRQQTFTLVLTSDGTTFSCSIGSIDPITTVSGVADRLQNLGYLDPTVTYDLSTLDTIRGALRQFIGDQQGGASSEPPSAPGSPASAGPPPSTPPASGPSSANGVPPAPPSAPVDNAGLDDNGTLVQATAQLLTTAHGS